MRRNTPSLLVVALSILVGVLIYNEFLVYYLVLRQCHWPEPTQEANSLYAMFIADTHLLGPTGHWWDRLRREWQMERTFQTSLSLHSPEVVFILGDVFDDGKWSSNQDFQADVQRFHKMFRHSVSTKLISLIGNHDVGFHYMITEEKLKRFELAVNGSSSIELWSFKNIMFVTVNSMAFEGDNCRMCRRATEDLNKIVAKLDCAKEKASTKKCVDVDLEAEFLYSQPILLQHYPMYRESDKDCDGEDSAPISEKYQHFLPTWDCLSKKASELLMHSLHPRLVVSGHTHHFCHYIHNNGVPEWSVPSFSWRNKKGSSFLMATITMDDFAISKCFMPNENTVVSTYIFFGIIATALIIVEIISRSFPKYLLTKHGKFKK